MVQVENLTVFYQCLQSFFLGRDYFPQGVFWWHGNLVIQIYRFDQIVPILIGTLNVQVLDAFGNEVIASSNGPLLPGINYYIVYDEVYDKTYTIKAESGDDALAKCYKLVQDDSYLILK